MEEEFAHKFEPDPYLEHLLELRKTKPFVFNGYPEEIRKVVEAYEREKEQGGNG